MATDPMTINVSMIEAVALAVLTYALGLQIKKRLTILQKLSMPAPVIGGMLFASVLSILEANGVAQFKFDSTLQTLLMLAFFTTIGLSASVKLIINGGKLLVMFLIAASVLGVFQNAIGMWIAEAMGIDFHYGLLAGGVSLMGGLGTSAAFGPYFEQTYGIAGGTVTAITAATFGMAVALMIGGPFGEWLIRRYKVVTPISVEQPGEKLHVPEDLEASIVDDHAAGKPALSDELMMAVGMIVICMAIGGFLSAWLGQFITLPAYIGSMIGAACMRNISDFTGKLKIEPKALNAVAEICLILYVTMAINSLKLHELVNLAVPLMVILIFQTILMLVFAWAVLFYMFGKTYDAVMLAVGGIGFGMGATANGLANMQALAEKYGSSPQAWLIVSVVGAFLIDLVNALIITWFAAL